MSDNSQSSTDSTYTKDFGKVYATEVEYLKKRRKKYDLHPRPKVTGKDGEEELSLPDNAESSWPEMQHGTVGLAFSGGGIRSATFNLGVLQGLCKHNLLKFVDYLSTVSGGAYIGSCLSSLLDNPDASVKKDEFPFRFERDQKDPGSGQWGDERKEVKHLRQYGNYLAPDQSLLSPHVWRMIGLFLTGLVLTNLIPLALLLLLMKLIHTIGDKATALAALPKAIFVGALFILLFMVVVRFLAGLRNLLYPHRLRLGYTLGWLTFLAGTLLTVGAVIGLTLKGQNALPNMLGFAKGWLNNNEGVMGGGLVSALLGLLIGAIRTKSSRLRLIREIIFRIAWVAILPIVYIIIAHVALNSDFIGEPYWPYVISVLALAVSVFVNANRVSLHHFYRDRLSEAYVIKRKSKSDAEREREGEISLSGELLEGDEDMIVSNEPLCLNKLHENETAPYHLINATLNVPDSKNRYLRGRGAELFLFSKEYVGSQSTGYRETGQYENGTTRLATAMAVSGAAASPQMGSSTSRVLTLLLTLLNVRMNRWMPNPKNRAGMRIPPGLWPWHFVKEILGKGKETDLLLNISDGGHHENLGVYPLLQRRCRFIIASDVGADPNFLMEDLANLMRKARIDLGVTFKLKLGNLRPNMETRETPRNYAIGTIHYPEGKIGVIVYIKSSLAGTEPEDILTYDRANPDFPDETTGDQFFDEAQFESYRELGYQIASNLFKNAGNWFEDMYQRDASYQNGGRI